MQDTVTLLDASADSLYTELEMFNSLSHGGPMMQGHMMQGHMTQAMSTDSIEEVSKHLSDDDVSKP